MGKNPTEAEFKALLDEFGKSVEMIDFGSSVTASLSQFSSMFNGY